MKISTLMLALLCFSQMAALSVAHSADKEAGLSDSELQQVRERLPCLKPGMSMKDVFDLLGVDLPRKAYGVSGSGPTDDYRMVYQLAPVSNEHGYNLVIVNDQDRRFKRAEIACWSPANKCEEDNEKAKRDPQECPVR